MGNIDSRACIDPSAVIGRNVSIGPWTLIGPDVVIGDNCVIHSHVVLKGPTTIGRDNNIYQFSTIGEDTPDLKYQGEPTRLVIGDNNVIREGVTIHRGTVQDNSLTAIGSNNLIMAYVHIGHDCVVGSNVILVNNASLAGHVSVGDWAIISGYAQVHQHVTIGAHSFIGAVTYLTQDVPAYVMVSGIPAEAKTINSEGLSRRGFSKEQIQAIKRAYKIVYRQGNTLEQALAALQPLIEEYSAVAVFADSLRSGRRGIVR